MPSPDDFDPSPDPFDAVFKAEGEKPRGRGRPRKTPDTLGLEVYDGEPPEAAPRVQTPTIKKLRDTHHTLARLMAEGKKGVEICALTGYSQSRLSILKNDPAFAELVEFYRANTLAQYEGLHQRLADFGGEILTVLSDRLDETPERFTVKELQGLLETTLDRSGKILPPSAQGAMPVAPPVINISFVPAPPPAAYVTLDQRSSPQVLEKDLDFDFDP